MTTLHVGITGTRSGATREQRKQLHDHVIRLVKLRARTGQHIFIHHGDCVGVDADFHHLVTEYGFITVSHPPTDPKLRAWCNADVVHHPRPYLTRNQDIVDSVNLLLVVPSGPETDNPRSGTWATFRMAKNDAVDFEVIEP